MDFFRIFCYTYSVSKFTVQFNLSIGCNATCFMCDRRVWGAKSKKTYRNLIKLLDFLDPDTVERVKLLGGEPLLDKKGLLLFLRVCRLKGFYCLFPTNGSLFTNDYFDKLVQAGLRELTISLDSFRAQEHDAIRGLPGMFKRIISILRYIRKRYPDFKLSLNFLILPQNIDSLDGTIALAETLKINEFNVLYPQDFGKNFDKIHLTADAKDKIEAVKLRYASSTMAINWNPCNVREDFLCSYQPNKLSVFEDGAINFCDHYPFKNKYKLDRPLKKILQEPEIRDFLSEHSLAAS